MTARSAATLLALLLVALPSCSDGRKPAARPSAPVLVLGVDGLEWSVLHPLLAAGRCPNLKGLMERGSYGKLGTFIPTSSPVIWTSIATGKSLREHGIGGFVDERGREFTSSRRRGRALWNIADEYGLTSNVLGWWITWPAEPIRGLMVSATSAAAMMDQNWKPALMEGLADQVHPPALTGLVMDLAREAGSREAVMALASQHIFGPLPELDELERDLVAQTLWSVQSDATYSRLALELLPQHPADLTLLYLGGPDVAGHRFFRQMRPGAYAWAGSSPEADAALGGVIPRYYEWVDGVLGELLAVVGPDTVVIVLSDHGMHEVSLEQPNARGNTGDHQDGPPGILVAAGPGIVAQGGVGQFLKSGQLLPIGSVMDICPTVLALLGIPPARDMQGRPNRLLFTPELRAAVAALGQVESHDDGFREPTLVEVPAEKEAEFIERMAQLGYLDGLEQVHEDSVPVDPSTFVPSDPPGELKDR